jgi:hypothetical protein
VSFGSISNGMITPLSGGACQGESLAWVMVQSVAFRLVRHACGATLP